MFTPSVQGLFLSETSRFVEHCINKYVTEKEQTMKMSDPRNKTKICSRCQHELPSTDFYRQKRTNSAGETHYHLSAACKECWKEDRRLKYEIDPAHRQYHRDWADTPKQRELAKKRAKIRYHTDPEFKKRRLAYNKKYYEAKKEQAQ